MATSVGSFVQSMTLEPEHHGVVKGDRHGISSNVPKVQILCLWRVRQSCPKGGEEVVYKLNRCSHCSAMGEFLRKGEEVKNKVFKPTANLSAKEVAIDS